MREIKFRGKRIKDGVWIKGSLVDDTFLNKYFIITFKKHEGNIIDVWEEVVPETVGQFIGLYDIDNKEIYEEDIAQATCIEDGVTYFGTITYDYSGFYLHVFNYDRLGLYDNDSLIELYELKNLQVLGNSHDNPELLEK